MDHLSKSIKEHSRAGRGIILFKNSVLQHEENTYQYKNNHFLKSVNMSKITFFSHQAGAGEPHQ